MGVFIDLSGRVFGDLTVIRRSDDYVSPKGYHAVNWLCECSCGTQKIVRAGNLLRGFSTSCGCKRILYPNRTTHGKSDTKLFSIWEGIKSRCYRESDKCYNGYGGRGIVMCDEWLNEFESFYDWAISSGYADGLSIDRIDNNGNYEPSNCRWATNKEQQNNKRNNHLITYNGETLTVSQWSEKTGIKYKKILERINKCGWSVEKALTTQ